MLVKSSELSQNRSGQSSLAEWKQTIVAVLACAIIAGLAVLLQRLSVLSLVSPMILAVAIGMTLNRAGAAQMLSPQGLSFVSRPLLRFAIVLLGFKLTWTQIYDIGFSAAIVITLSLIATMVATISLGSVLGVSPGLTQLIAAGTSICGASAIVATNAVSKASDEDVAYALACVTLCGTVAMLVFPMLIPVLNLDQYHYGVWAGASIHEVAQVVGAAFQGGSTAGEYGTVAKLMRVALLAPVVVGLGYFAKNTISAGEAETQKPAFPLFILAFLAVVSLNSVVEIPADVKLVIATIAMFCLTMALAAIGLAADIRKLWGAGPRPLLLGICASFFIAGVSLGLVKFWL